MRTWVSSAPLGSAKNTLHEGFSALTAVLTPAARPPPPTGITTASRAPAVCSISSMPKVPAVRRAKRALLCPSYEPD